MVVFCNSGQAAELSEGSGLSPASAVKVLSAESEEDLSRSVTAWVEQRYPQDTITVRGFQYLADDRALHVIKTLTMEGTHRTIFFETPGLPFQFVRKKP
ncbi:hypothetical protein ASD94_01290 [Acidovorax sp. Root70]|nr:hypothetical protein ASD94_01290 [Acidovorax sp. Root70]